MKQLIDDIAYDTEKATLLDEWDNFRLYLANNHRYFLHTLKTDEDRQRLSLFPDIDYSHTSADGAGLPQRPGRTECLFRLFSDQLKND